MKSFFRVILVSAWILPVLAFPSEQDGLYPHHRIGNFSLSRMGSGYWKDYRQSYYSGCFTPVPLCFAYAKPADFFVQSGSTYELGPHWKYWIIWIGLAIGFTAYIQRKTKTSQIDGNNS